MRTPHRSPKKPAKHNGTSKTKDKSRIVNILLRATILITPLLYLSYIKFEFRPLQEILFIQITLLLKLIGLQFQTFGYTITTQTFSSIITFDCTAWRQLYIYFALVLLPPGISWAKRFWGFAFLVPLYIYNTLGQSSRYGSEA